MRNGYGVMSWPDGTVFEGEWLNDERNYGKQTMTDNNIYEGSFQNDKFHGVGKITFTREQMTFEGLFKEGKQSNVGRLINQKNNEVYVGEVVDNVVRHGLGMLLSKDRKYEGEFKDDDPVGLGRISFENGDVYYGETSRMLRVGSGRMEFDMKDCNSKYKMFEGQYDNDKRDGVGYLYLRDGRVYCGQFRNDLEEGIGEYLNTSKDIHADFKKVKMAQIEMYLDQIAKQVSFLSPLGIKA